MKILPSFVHKHIAHRPKLIKIVDNMGWLFIDKALRVGVGLFVGVWVARYLGPEQFGQLSFALAFVGMFGALATLGLNGIVVRDLVKHPVEKYSILGTALGLQLFGALIAFGLMIGAITWMRPDDGLTRVMVIIFGLGGMFRCSEVVSYWFESQVESRYTVWVTNSVLMLVAATKVGLILQKAPLLAFVWITLLEAILTAIALFLIYLKKENALHHWFWQLERAKTLLKESWPLMLSGVAVIIYMRIDQIMLGEMISSEAVGVYSAALRLSEAWYMVPMVVVGSLFPAIVKLKERSIVGYKAKMQELLNLMATIGIVIAVCVSLLSETMIVSLFGVSYIEAAPVLTIHVWSCVFIFLGVVSGRGLVAEGLQIFDAYRTGVGCVINIGANFILIPKYGVVGAAFATLLSQASAAYFFDILNKKTRSMFYMKSIALFSIPRFFMGGKK